MLILDWSPDSILVPQFSDCLFCYEIAPCGFRMSKSVLISNFGLLIPLFASALLLCHLGIVVTAFSIEEYCDFFTADVRPVICVLKAISSTSTTPKTNATNVTECWCELSCWPKANWTESDLLTSSSEEWFYDCESCGSRCWVNESSKDHAARPTCSCAIVGGSSRKSKCSCTARCATFRSLPFKNYLQHIGGGPPRHLPPMAHAHPFLQKFHHHHRPPPPYHHHGYDYDESEEDDDEVSTNCIFTVTNVYDGLLLDNSSRPLNCECTRSKRAEDTSAADFICICQQV